ncbi:MULTISPECIES: branched-chain amino acid ABC transporter permease [Actinomadura]|uniref:Branched-chain amino acid ABC transporter permease n=1 Tax=Actinomadura litoris TaxID=2678616 RepID=A0A7K1L340_9ACTN|nr:MULTISPECIES: branched-chain amino acid ABC transporter permease [Actinomadura]MBT2213404.1 branched-chain amino acid ABC transporter permease [Actinomadura sp. NEAU-AAG7]MUN38840.1 branched-chain amino acid ABC transporter permease [Actinomadura litoris]
MLEGAIAGLAGGGAYAALGLCLTLMFRLVRVVNFAQVAIGVIGVYTMAIASEHGWPYGAAALAGLLAATLVAAVLGWVMGKWFGEAGADQRSAISIAFLVGLLAVSYLVFGTDPRRMPGKFGGSLFTVDGITVTQAAAVCAVGSVVVAGAAWLVLTRTVLGLRLRALSERPTTAELHAIPSRRLGVGMWAVTGLLAAAVLLVVAPQQTSDQTSLALMVIPAGAAALVGGFTSLGRTVAGGLGLGALQGALAHVTELQQYRDTVPFLAILAILIWSQRREVWDAAR